MVFYYLLSRSRNFIQFGSNQGNRKHNKYDYLVRKISVRSIIIRNYFGNYICHFIKIFYTFMYYNNTSSTSTYSILLHTQ